MGKNRNAAQQGLVQALDQLATALELLEQGNGQLIINAGFLLQQDTGLRYSGRLPAPVILRANSTGKKGEVRMLIDDMAPVSAVTNHAIEYSVDRGNGWQNGQYNSHRNFVASGLPPARDLWLRVKTLGRGNNRSEWSEPVVVGVL